MMNLNDPREKIKIHLTSFPNNLGKFSSLIEVCYLELQLEENRWDRCNRATLWSEFSLGLFFSSTCVCVCVTGLCPALRNQTSHAPCIWRSCMDLSPESWPTTSDSFSVWTSSMTGLSVLPREPLSCSFATPACCDRWEKVERWGWLLTLLRWKAAQVWSSSLVQIFFLSECVFLCRWKWPWLLYAGECLIWGNPTGCCAPWGLCDDFLIGAN